MNMLRNLRTRMALACLAALLPLAPAHASVTISNTRVVYPLGEREVTVQLTNDSNKPSLVQVWLDDGDPSAKPGEAKAPFIVTPPIFRMSPQKAQTLRVIHTGDPLPTDRESVFWLNVLDIPPKASGESANANVLQLAFRTRIKLFVRPPKLDGEAEEAPGKLQWQLVDADGGRGKALKVTNPTPFHVSFSEVAVESGAQVFRNDVGGMVAPHASTVFTMPRLSAVGPGAQVRFTAISDFASPLPGQAALEK